MKRFEIGLYQGDGIGLEVLEEAVRVLRKVQESCKNLDLNFSRFDLGADYYAHAGHIVPKNYPGLSRPFDVIFLEALAFSLESARPYYTRTACRSAPKLRSVWTR